jgi:hypothetical protein
VLITQSPNIFQYRKICESDVTEQLSRANN